MIHETIHPVTKQIVKYVIFGEGTLRIGITDYFDKYSPAINMFSAGDIIEPTTITPEFVNARLDNTPIEVILEFKNIKGLEALQNQLNKVRTLILQREKQVINNDIK